MRHQRRREPFDPPLTNSRCFAHIWLTHVQEMEDAYDAVVDGSWARATACSAVTLAFLGPLTVALVGSPPT
ncbi:hypothetical protein ACIBI9_18480 [Nonomuraea sp. NPDC050451]|uniref:hypothetical protein n=1 Tax=Nonomuraea sp. NPDC050451 TaxID=3364364 RepID=UPI0037A9ACA9